MLWHLNPANLLAYPTHMVGFFKYLCVAGLLLVLAMLGYGALGYVDAIGDAHGLRQRADGLIAQGLGGQSLGADRLQQMLRVEDPNFWHHAGMDMSTPGAGMTTITQSAAKRLAFDSFKPGIGKIRQTGFALGMEQVLSKQQILALWLDSLEMGPGPDGWMTGFFRAAQKVYGRMPDNLDDQEFQALLAVLIAPSKYRLGTDDPALQERIRRIARLIADSCTPVNHADVWLEGCR